MPSSSTNRSAGSGASWSAGTREAKRTSAAAWERAPSLLMTNGTGLASDRNALLPRWRRYSWPSRHSRLSDSGTKSWITSRLAWARAKIASGEASAEEGAVVRWRGLVVLMVQLGRPLTVRAGHHKGVVATATPRRAGRPLAPVGGAGGPEGGNSGRALTP